MVNGYVLHPAQVGEVVDVAVDVHLIVSYEMDMRVEALI
jgi:hypothetical protein